MAESGKTDITAAAGPDAREAAYRRQFEALYAQLQALARRELRATPRNTLCTTALVHEVYLKLQRGLSQAGDRGSFLALAAKAMRCVLVDHARARRAGKRGGDLARVTLVTDIPLGTEDRQVDLLEIEQGLQALERLEPRLVTVVECRFFAGMEFGEIADHLGLSPRTVHRDWRRARAFLETQLSQGGV